MYPEETYFLVGATEADPRNGRISNESPIGKALLGGHVGDEVTASHPGWGAQAENPQDRVNKQHFPNCILPKNGCA